MIAGKRPRLDGIMDWFGGEAEPAAVTLAYDREAIIAKQNSLHGVLPPFAVLDCVSDVPEETARGFQREAWALADRLRGSGVLDPTFAGYVTWFANHGGFMYPSRDQLANDPEALDALNAALVKFGIADLKHRILAARRLTLKTQAEELERKTAFWETAYGACQYLSGEIAVEKCLEYVRRIGASTQEIRAALASAREAASPEEYAELLAMASPVNAQLSRMNRYVHGGDDETGGALGAATLAIVVVAGVALVLLAGIFAYIESVRAAVTAQANAIIARRQQEMADSRDREAWDIDHDPDLSDAEKAEAKAGLEREYRDKLARLPAPVAPAGIGLALPGGMLAVAALGLAALLFVPRLLGGRK